MKKAISILSTAIAASQLFVVKAFAGLTDPGSINGLASGGGGAAEIKAVITRVLIIVLDFITILGVIFVVVAGIRLIISGGDEGEKDKAKKTIIYVIVGILVVIFARVIVTFVANIA